MWLKLVVATSAFLAATSVGFAGLDVRQIVLEEIASLRAADIPLPLHALVVTDFQQMNGMVIATAEPVQYVMLMRPRYWREDLARAVAAHEAGHLAALGAGLKGTYEEHERYADVVGVCFGTEGARRGLERYHNVTATEAECAAMRETLGGTPR